MITGINETENDQIESDISKGEKQKVQALLITFPLTSWLCKSGELREGWIGRRLREVSTI